MLMTTQLYAQVTAGATTDDVAAFDVPEKGKIWAVEWNFHHTAGMATEDHIVGQLSFLSTNQFSSNDARGVISNGGIGVCTVTTSGLAGYPLGNLHSFPVGLEVTAGERIHLHTLVSAGVTGFIRCVVHLDVGRTSRRSRRTR